MVGSGDEGVGVGGAVSTTWRRDLYQSVAEHGREAGVLVFRGALTPEDAEAIFRTLLDEAVGAHLRDEARRVERNAAAEDEREYRHQSRDLVRWKAEHRAADEARYPGLSPFGVIVKEFDAFVARERLDAKLELTVELLSSTFAIGDGTTVTWGAATREDHERRVDLLARNVIGNLTTMHLHRLAVDMLDERQAQCLNDLVAVPA